MNWILLVYVAVNMFAAGYFCAEKWPYAETEDEKFSVSCAVLVMGLAGILILTPVILYDSTTRAIKWIGSFFQIGFWIGFYFKGQYNDMKPDQLATFNQWGIQKGRTTLRGKLFNRCVDKINQRNNYTYKEPDPTSSNDHTETPHNNANKGRCRPHSESGGNCSID